MITCPWCGTSYAEFQPQCDRCGGSIPSPGPLPSTISDRPLIITPPPPPPRQISNRAIWRILLGDSWSIGSFILALVGSILIGVGISLTIGIITAIVGIPLVFLGLALGALGAGVFIWRYQFARGIVEILKFGETTEGLILNVYQNPGVRVNGRYPWTIEYQFEVSGRLYEGKITTLSVPLAGQLSGDRAYILHMPHDPQRNTIYPSPYA